MRKYSTIFRITFLTVVSLAVVFGLYAQQSNAPLPPPVNISFSLQGTPRIGEELGIKVTVTPKEDMHADISCLLPLGVDPVYEKGIRIHHYQQPAKQSGLPREYFYSIGLWTGFLKAGESKEFTFKVKPDSAKAYKLLGIIRPLAQWGVKEEVFYLNFK